MNPLLHYECLAEFKRQRYAELLTYEHVVGGQRQINTVVLPDGSKEENYNFWGYLLEKNGVRYLLPAKDKDDNEINLRDVLPIKVHQSQKIGFRNQVYEHIMRYSSAKFKSEQTMSFKEMIDTLAGFKHTNPQHQKIAWLMGISQMYARANYRLCSPASFGKDSIVDTFGHLIGGCATIVNPTRAKLEFRTMYKWLAVNEVTRIGHAEWLGIEQFLLDAGAFKPSIEKQTRAFGNVGESLDISQHSESLFYNDIDHLQGDEEDFIDLKAHRALLNRFPAFRLWGVLSDEFNKIRAINVPEFVKANMATYNSLIHAFAFYKKNYIELLHHYKKDKLCPLINEKFVPERWKTNIGVLLYFVDLYSDNQEEFDMWVEVINKSLEDYASMLDYPALREKYFRRLTPLEKQDMIKELDKFNTFTEKNKFITDQIQGGPIRDKQGVWSS